MRIFYLFFILFGMTNGFSQTVLSKSYNAGQLPWVSGKLPSNSSFYTYKVVQGQGMDLIEARNNTIKNLAFELGTERGVNISSETISNLQKKVERTNKTKNTYVNSEYLKKTTISQPGFDVVFSKVDEYYETISSNNGGVYYKVWHLYTIGKNSNTVPKLRYTSKYTMGNAGFRSALVPGWGQFYKKRNAKGFTFVVAATACVGGFIYTNNKYNYNKNRIAESSSLELQKEFSSRADDFKAYKNIALGAAAVTWIWSIVDAISTDGDPKYANTTKFKMDLFSPLNQEGIALSFKYDF